MLGCLGTPLFPAFLPWLSGGMRVSLIKGLTIRYCCSRSEAWSRNHNLLVCLIDHLKSQVDSGSTSCLGPYHSALAELAELDSLAAKGAQVRSRIKWAEEGETSSAYFFRLERKCSADWWISALRESDGSIVSSSTDLCHTLSFYSLLFATSPTDSSIQSSLLGNLTSALSPDQAASCEGCLTNEECLAALLGMARRKTPGLDGLPMEFYVKFWDVLGSDLVDVLNCCFDSGCLALSQQRGIIALSFKKGDRLDPRIGVLSLFLMLTISLLLE